MSQLPPLPPSNIPLQYATPQHQDPNVLAVAIAQRRIMWVILGAILLAISLAGSSALTPNSGPAQYIVLGLLAIIRIAIIVLMMVSVYQLSKALGNSTAANVLYVIAMIIPCVSLIVLLVLNQKATTFLKTNGVKVGLMGAKLSDLSSR